MMDERLLLWVQDSPPRTHLFVVASTPAENRIQVHAQDSGEYLSAMPNLRSLMLHHTGVEYAGEDEFRTCFSAFRETLTYLSLETFATSFSTFVTVIDYFLNITTLQLCSFELEPDEGSVPSLSHPFGEGTRLRSRQSLGVPGSICQVEPGVLRETCDQHSSPCSRAPFK